MMSPNPVIPESPRATSSDVVVSVRGLTKVFNDFWGRPKAKAVDNVEFEIRRGEIFGLLGPNGSGKSTTVKMLLGLLNATRGHIEIFGHSPQHVATKALLGYLPEESYLYRFLNSRETLDFFGKLFQLDKASRERRTTELLEMVGLSQANLRAVGEFSKGMQRRIGLAQALINDPQLVILDEPTAGLDPLGCREVKDVITALARRGKTVILTSHLLSDVEDVCDRVVIYYGGRIQAMGTLNELLTKPDTIRITSPVLSRPVLESVLKTIRTEVAEDKVRIDNPTQNLESYFLEVVEKARSASTETSGATSGNKVAAFLQGDGASSGSTGASQANKVLERLMTQAPGTASASAASASAPGATATSTTAPAVESTVDRAKLASLAKGSPTAGTSSPSHAPAAAASAGSNSSEPKGGVEPVKGPSAEEVAKANQKLSNLLNKPKNTN